MRIQNGRLGVGSILPVLVVLGVVLLLALIGAAPAFAGSSWWRLDSVSAPTNLPLGGEGQLVLSASNVGEGTVDGGKAPVILTDELPEGVTPIGAVEVRAIRGTGPSPAGCEFLHLKPGHVTVRCESKKTLFPYGGLLVRFTVRMEETEETLKSPPVNVVRIEGGLTPPVSLERPLRVDEAPTPFGVQAYGLAPEGEGGSPDMKAGSHPFQLTTTLDFNQVLETYTAFGEEGVFPSSPALVRDLRFVFPAGLVGAVGVVARCSDADFSAASNNLTNLCPADTAVGVASVVVNDPKPLGYTSLTVPVFNLEPAPGEPVRLGIDVANVPVVLKTAVPAGGAYDVQVSIKDVSQAVQVLSSQVTIWGVPGDPSHDAVRGWGCLEDLGSEEATRCEHLNDQAPSAFLTLPTSCEAAPFSTLTGDSWTTSTTLPPHTLEGEYVFPAALTGCGLLAFEPTLSVGSEEHAASTPTGLTVGVHIPQEGLLTPQGQAQSAVKDTTVTLPEGVQVNPSAANGLGACSEEQIGYEHTNTVSGVEEFTPGQASCPEASMLGTVEIQTPILPEKLTGSVYLAEPAPNSEPGKNPFASLLALYILAEDKTLGLRVKLAGEGKLDPATGQISTTFQNTPQLPFEELKLKLFGGPRGSLSTPPSCGSYSASSSFTAWSGATRTPLSEPPFPITTGPNNTPCPPNPLPFAPAIQAGSTSNQAGAFTPFTLQIERPDGNQALIALTIHLPPGLAAMLATITPCPEPQAAQAKCGPESLIGHSTASSGLGNEPVKITGRVYLTGPYEGAPFGIEAVTPAIAGPFNLGNVTVRSTLNVDPHTAAATISSDPLPTMLKGVPVQLKQLEVIVDRPGFTFNPTNCDPLQITGTLSGSQGASVPVSYPFQVTNCATLPFNPTFTATTQGQTSKANGASLTVKVTSSPGQANIAKTTVTLPIALPSRLTTIQKACVNSVFEANPASCPEGSVVGTAIVHTPVLKSPVSGPAYLVSHGGAAFPDLEFVLQGEGITLILDGQTNIKKGITSSTFDAVPDAPVSSFETILPEGPHSALTTNLPASAKYSLCATSLQMPTVITGQNGAVIEQDTKIAVQGCQGVAASKTKKLTRAQQLNKALVACRHKYKRSRAKRAACEKQARKRYAAKKASHKATKAGHGRKP